MKKKLVSILLCVSMVENFPVVAVIDSEGNNLYEKGRREYLETVDANGNA